MDAKNLNAKLVNIELLTANVNNSKSIYKAEYLKSFKQKSDTAKRNFIRKQVFLKLAKQICLAFRLKETENQNKFVAEFNKLCSIALIDKVNKPKFTSEKNADFNSILVECYSYVDNYNKAKK
jgi:hypothetical protein